MVNFVKLLSKEKDVDVNSIFSSSIQLSDGVIIKVNNIYYRVSLSPDQNTYSLVEAKLTNPDTIIIKK
ncbi:Protein of uncharacterised function (DUF3290) [Providencia rustigianii]|nr:Protein of uncharacterised function (DUF3290) [Providencia rustigianii]